MIEAKAIELRFISTTDPLYQKERDLRVEILRKPLGMAAGTEVFPFENESFHLVALYKGNVVGCVLFHPEEKTGRLFQMAVASELQKSGIGSILVAKMEEELATRGFEEIYLHAREVASKFYLKLGYRIFGDEFEEVGIKHFHMKKRLRNKK